MPRAEPEFDQQAAHRHFSAHCFNQTWALMNEPSRTAEQNQEMLDASHASLWHWRKRGELTPIKLSVAYWQLSRVHALLGSAAESERYGKLSLENASHADTPAFFRAYAFEALARAASLSGRQEQATAYRQQARALGEQVGDEAERARLFADLNAIEATIAAVGPTKKQ
jgi:hypothetical protein